ncbi:MAG: hypothetical protein JOZ31_22515 [Verrucomicrobia bacterium]|nr:hypothetical protein [Verrucomicrobiota bacterium]MBV8482659.1 hypothetical protein [Verrucomicrobiota bacterium]
MTYYEFTSKTSFSGGKPTLSGIARAPDSYPLDLIESEIAGTLNSSGVTLRSSNLDLENEFRRRRELTENASGARGLYANLGIVEVIIF